MALILPALAWSLPGRGFCLMRFASNRTGEAGKGEGKTGQTRQKRVWASRSVFESQRRRNGAGSGITVIPERNVIVLMILRILRILVLAHLSSACSLSDLCWRLSWSRDFTMGPCMLNCSCEKSVRLEAD